jgi:O-antigen ligase
VYFLASGSALAGLAREAATLKAPGLVRREFTYRANLAAAAVKVWRLQPWFGTGGWGYRYLAGTVWPEEQRQRLEKAGLANVHNDPIQFVSEFGVVGTALMAVTAGALAVPLLRRRPWRSVHGWFLCAGPAAVCAHSLIDLPFRSPAVLYHWLAVVAIAPVVLTNEACDPEASAEKDDE